MSKVILKTGNSMRDKLGKFKIKHGLCESITYSSWVSMNSRVLHDKDYVGMEVYEEWRNSFISFYDHIGERPSLNHTLDRIDSHQGYTPGNVRWATKQEQCLNRKHRCTNEVGISGITKQGSKYKIDKTIGGKRIIIYGIDTKEDAINKLKELLISNNVYHLVKDTLAGEVARRAA